MDHNAWWHLLSFFGIVNETGPGYGFWSGFGSDLGELAIIGSIIGYAKHHNCEVKGCWRLGHPHEGRVACKTHHPHPHPPHPPPDPPTPD